MSVYLFYYHPFFNYYQIIGDLFNPLNCSFILLNTLLPLKEQSPSFLNPVRAITNYDSHTLLIGIDGGGVYVVDRCVVDYAAGCRAAAGRGVLL